MRTGASSACLEFFRSAVARSRFFLLVCLRVPSIPPEASGASSLFKPSPQVGVECSGNPNIAAPLSPSKGVKYAPCGVACIGRPQGLGGRDVGATCRGGDFGARVCGGSGCMNELVWDCLLPPLPSISSSSDRRRTDHLTLPPSTPCPTALRAPPLARTREIKYPPSPVATTDSVSSRSDPAERERSRLSPPAFPRLAHRLHRDHRRFVAPADSCPSIAGNCTREVSRLPQTQAPLFSTAQPPRIPARAQYPARSWLSFARNHVLEEASHPSRASRAKRELRLY